MVFILIHDHENVGLNAFVISLSCIISEILHKVNFSIMVEANLNIGNIYTCIYIYSCYNCLVVFIFIIDLDNVGVDTFIISLSFITSEILKKVYFSLMAVANLHISNICFHIITF